MWANIIRANELKVKREAAEIHEQRLQDMARFIVSFSYKPEDYYALTLEIHRSVVDVWNRDNKPKK